MSKVRGLAYLALARILGAALQLFVARFVLDQIGKEGLGVIFLAIATSRWFLLAELNSFEGCQRRVAVAVANKDWQGVANAWVTFERIFILNSMLVMALHLIGGAFVQFNYDQFLTSSWMFFVLTGVYFVVQQMSFAGSAYLVARQKLVRLSQLSALLSFLTGLFVCIFVNWLKSPEGFMIGFSLGVAVVVALNYWLIRREMSTFGLRPVFDRNDSRAFIQLGLRSWPNRLAATVSGTTDRVVMGQLLGEAKVAEYGNASRLPDVASEALPFNTLVTADLTVAHSRGRKEFGAAVERLSVMGFALSMACIVIPSGAGVPFLKIWLGPHYTSEMPLILLGIGLYRAMDSFYTALGFSFYAEGKPEKTMPFTLYNGILTLALMVPAVKQFGIMGAVYLKLLIHFTQYVPFLFYAKRFMEADLNLASWSRQYLGVLFIGLALAAGLLSISYTPIGERYILLTAILAPLVAYGYICAIHYGKFVQLPESIRRRLKLR